MNANADAPSARMAEAPENADVPADHSRGGDPWPLVQPAADPNLLESSNGSGVGKQESAHSQELAHAADHGSDASAFSTVPGSVPLLQQLDLYNPLEKGQGEGHENSTEGCPQQQQQKQQQQQHHHHHHTTATTTATTTTNNLTSASGPVSPAVSPVCSSATSIGAAEEEGMLLEQVH